ncbi:hypothetical protein B0H14DRAFT_3481718 [Mycena olivaceomarginata]|nr:hypothetical protein B0H14DRAFT_3481718 [Mycena olivaceomarginata]
MTTGPFPDAGFVASAVHDSESEEDPAPKAVTGIKPKATKGKGKVQPTRKPSKPHEGGTSGDGANYDSDQVLSVDEVLLSPEEDLEEDPYPHVIPTRTSSVEPDNDEDVDMGDAGKRTHGRRYSSSSSTFDIPATIDFESENDIHQARDDDESDAQDSRPPNPSPHKPIVKARPQPPKKTSGKIKIKAEQRDTPIPTATDIDNDDQSQWGISGRIVYPGKGAIKPTDQHPELQGVLRDAMELALVDIGFENSYPDTRPLAEHIKTPVRDDPSFSQAFADLMRSCILSLSIV